jgi:hypothetical protein
MTLQREGLLLPESNTPPVDLALFESFEAAHLDSTDIYEQLTPGDEQKKAGLDALRRGEEADFSVQENHDDLTRETIADRLRALQEWKQKLVADESMDADIKQLYRWKVNEDIANVHMLEASIDGDMPRFTRWNEFIYGKPDETVYRAALDWVANDADVLLAHGERYESIENAANEVLSMLGSERGYRELLAPTEETFQAVQEDHLREGGYYALMCAGVEIPESGKITIEEALPLIEFILRNNLESEYELEPTSGKSWSVAHSRMKLKHPKEFNMLVKRFKGLVPGHELRHIVEYMNGRRGPARLASRGFDRTERSSESRGIIGEMVVYDTFEDFGNLVRWRDILRRDIAIGYGSGIGQDGPRTSQQIYTFMNAIDTMYQSKLTPSDSKMTADKAHKKTGDLLAGRVLRGVKGEQGGVYQKDQVYLEGHVATWLTAALRGPQAISDGDLGKFDINNPRHIAFLQKVGLLGEETV